MADEIPGIIDESRLEDSAPLPSHRGLWSPWTWFSDEFVQCLQRLDIEQVMLFACRCPKEEIVRLKAIAGLKQVTLGWSGAVGDVERELKAARPDINVKEAFFRSSRERRQRGLP